MKSFEERYAKSVRKQQLITINDLEAALAESQRAVSECGKKLRICRAEKQKLKKELIDEMAR